MVASDQQEKERIDARNALEEYVYELREKLSSDEEFTTFVNENERSTLDNQLQYLEKWLYEEGEESELQIFIQELNSLKVSWYECCFPYCVCNNSTTNAWLFIH